MRGGSRVREAIFRRYIMDSDVKNFESLYRVELMTRAVKDVVAEFAGGGTTYLICKGNLAIQ